MREVLEKPVKQIWASTPANGRLAISKGDEQAVTFGILNFASFAEFEEGVCQDIQGDGAVDVLFSADNSRLKSFVSLPVCGNCVSSWRQALDRPSPVELHS